VISRNYEVLVVDPSPGALIAATLLAREGHSVLVLDEEGPPAAAGGFRFLRHQPPVSGFGHGLLLKRCLKALKFHPHELQAVRTGSPGLQVVSGRRRLNLPGNEAELNAELQREYPRDAASIQDVIRRCRQSAGSFADALDRAVEEAGQPGFLQQVGLARPGWNPPLPPDDVPTWGEFLDGTDLSHDGRTLLRALMRPFCHLDVVEDLPLPVAGIQLAAALDGGYADPSEEHALLALLIRRVKAMRVDVLSERLTGLLGNKRRIEAATFEGKDEEMPLSWLVTGGDPEGLLDLLPGNPRNYDKVLSRLAPSHFRYSIYLGVASEVVPPDLAEHCILLGDGDVEDPAGCTLMSTTSEGSPLAPEGRRSITLSTLLPYPDDRDLPTNLDVVAGTMLDRVKWLMPWLERYLEVVQIPTDVDPSDGSPIAVDLRPAAYTPASAPADDPVSAGLGVHMPHKNLYCAGPAAFPALGLGGEALAGRLVERLALSGKR